MMSSPRHSIFYKYEKPIQALLVCSRIFPRFVYRWIYNLVEPFPGVVFVLIRYVAASRLCRRLGSNVYIANYVELRNVSRLVVGSNVSFQKGCYIDAIGGIDIGDDVSIAHYCSIVSFEHTWNDLSLPIRSNPLRLESITIASDVWIGAGARVLAGARIPTRCVVAAGAVVTKRLDSSDGALIAGVPAHQKHRIS